MFGYINGHQDNKHCDNPYYNACLRQSSRAFILPLHDWRRGLADRKNTPLSSDDWLRSAHGLANSVLMMTGEHGHPISNGMQRIKITGYQKNGKSKRLFQLFGEPVKFGCADRVQPGGWFIEKSS
jgi:hypothetical protein